jgi:hypothetical protein
MRKQIHALGVGFAVARIRGYAGLKTAAEHAMQHRVEPMRGSPGQRRQVTPGQPTARPGHIADHVDGDLITCEQVP